MRVACPSHVSDPAPENCIVRRPVSKVVSGLATRCHRVRICRLHRSPLRKSLAWNSRCPTKADGPRRMRRSPVLLPHTVRCLATALALAIVGAPAHAQIGPEPGVAVPPAQLDSDRGLHVDLAWD